MPESRRTFLKHSVATVAAASTAACAAENGGAPDRAPPVQPTQPPSTPPPPLPAPTLRAVGQAVLPADNLGPDGVDRAVTAFAHWADGLDPVAELPHPYLVPETRYSGPDPRPAWTAQLHALEKECHLRYAISFDALDIPTRRALLARPLGQGDQGNPDRALGPPANANHVSLALIAHFYASPIATDLCHGRTIAKQQCRGLDGAAAEPAALGASAPPTPPSTEAAQ